VPDLDVVRVQDASLSGATDRDVLEWAAREDRVVVSHDVATLGRSAWERVAAGHPMPGVIQISQALPVGRAIDDLVLIAQCGRPGDLRDRVTYLPL
jgi:hypothetical protein